MIQPLATTQDRLPAVLEYEDPTLVLDRSKKWANALMQVVNDQGMYAVIQQKKYLEVEAWQLVCMFAQAHAIAREPTPETDSDGNIIGYQCVADLFQNGELIGMGTSSCGLDQNSTRDRSGSDQHKAAKSTAQTWAISRAIKNTYGFVASLAGFETTPAEEMSGTTALATDSMMVCPSHNIEWFKRGAMKQFAHPIEGEKGPRGGAKWCNQDDVLQGLTDQMKILARELGWSEEINNKQGALWVKMAPAEKAATLAGLRQTEEQGTPAVDEATGEILAVPLDDRDIHMYPDSPIEEPTAEEQEYYQRERMVD